MINEYHNIPYHTIPYHTMPYHAIPCHTISYHIISSISITMINTLMCSSSTLVTHKLLVTIYPGATSVPPHSHFLKTTMTTCHGHCRSAPTILEGSLEIDEFIKPQPFSVFFGSIKNILNQTRRRKKNRLGTAR